MEERKNNIVYVYEFNDLKTAYIGRTCEPKYRHYRHMHDTDDNVYKFIKNHPYEKFVLKRLKYNLSTKDSAVEERLAIDRYRKDGWTLINKAKGGSVGAVNEKYTYEYCVDLAKKFEYLKDFYGQYPNVCDKCWEKGWMKGFIWLKKRKPKNEYAFNEVLDAAKECTSIRDFIYKYHSYYSYSKKKGWYEMIREIILESKKTNGIHPIYM